MSKVETESQVVCQCSACARHQQALVELQTGKSYLDIFSATGIKPSTLSRVSKLNGLSRKAGRPKKEKV